MPDPQIGVNEKRQGPETQAGGLSLLRYNVRILLGSSYWLLVTPVAAAQLVLFWNMAIVSTSGAPFASRTIELLAPILGAFLCAHVLAPEQGKVGELVFVRPISVERVLILRVAAIFAFALVAMLPVLVFYSVKVDGFALAATVLAAAPSMIFLSVLSLAAASALRQPLFGFAAAGAFWAADLATGGYYNQLVTLDSFADMLGGRPMSDPWLWNKLLLTVLAVLAYLLLRRRLGQPAAPRRWRTTVAHAIAALLIALAYVGSGAAYKIAYGLEHEREFGPRARLWYQLQFDGYGPLPVARLFGPAFPLYAQADLSSGGLAYGDSNAAMVTPADVGRLRELLERYPRSIWADNAQFEIALAALKQRPREPGLLIGRLPGEGRLSQQLLDQDLEGARKELELLVERYPGSAFGPFALSQLAAFGLSELDYPLAINSYEELIRDYPDTPDAFTAGLRSGLYYLSIGQPEKALAAADIAARAAQWDVQAEALLAAARAAEAAGKDDVARDRYQRARAAAHEAAERSLAGARSPSRLNKGEMFTSANAVVNACDKALAGKRAGGAGQRPSGEGVAVTGRVLLDGRPVEGARVALGAPDARGFPSPFTGRPAVQASTGAEGGFAIEKVPEGQYPALAVWLRLGWSQAEWGKMLAALPLPVSVGQTPLQLGDLTVSTIRPTQRAPSRTRAGGASSAGRGERPGGRLPTRRVSGGRLGRGE